METTRSLNVHFICSARLRLGEVKEGDDVYLKCDVRSNPRPERDTRSPQQIGTFSSSCQGSYRCKTKLGVKQASTNCGVQGSPAQPGRHLQLGEGQPHRESES